MLPQLRRPIHPLRDMVSYHRIKEALRRFRPDVVHTHSAKGGILGRAAAWSSKVPAIVHTVHGAPFHPYQGRGARALFRACECWAARRCHALISVADAMTELMVAAGVAPREKFTTVYSGMEVEPFLEADQHRQRIRRELGYRDEHLVIGKIARLFNLKGHQYVIRAAEQLAAMRPEARFLLVGDGILREKLRRQIAEAKLDDRFQMTGLVPPRRIPELIAAMDVVVHASLREGLARVLPQALIAGKPVVSYDVDGAAEVVADGETGYLLPPKSVEPMVDVLDRLAGDADLRHKLGSAGRRVADRFGHGRMTARVRDVYVEILGRPGRNRATQ